MDSVDNSRKRIVGSKRERATLPFTRKILALPALEKAKARNHHVHFLLRLSFFLLFFSFFISNDHHEKDDKLSFCLINSRCISVAFHRASSFISQFKCSTLRPIEIRGEELRVASAAGLAVAYLHAHGKNSVPLDACYFHFNKFPFLHAGARCFLQRHVAAYANR